jgi:hypothetical protein
MTFLLSEGIIAPSKWHSSAITKIFEKFLTGTRRSVYCCTSLAPSTRRDRERADQANTAPSDDRLDPRYDSTARKDEEMMKACPIALKVGEGLTRIGKSEGV